MEGGRPNNIVSYIDSAGNGEAYWLNARRRRGGSVVSATWDLKVESSLPL